MNLNISLKQRYPIIVLSALSQAGSSKHLHIYSVSSELYKKDPNATVFHIRKIPWAYLCCDWRRYGPTTWTTELNDERIMNYYRLHDGILPDYCFIYASSQGAYTGNIWNNHKTEVFPNIVELSGDLYDRLLKDYNITNNSQVTFFIKK